MSEPDVKPSCEYLVSFKSNEMSLYVEANDAVVEPCGALSLFTVDSDGKRVLKAAYSSGVWGRVTRK